MSDLIEQLWPAFLAESNEHLEALELGLVRSSAEERDVNALFRSFHTLKGGCAMMGFVNMESIAHACEDLLDAVRKGQRPLDAPLVDGLLAAIDCLKRQLVVAEAERRDPQPDPALLARLRAMAAGPVHAAPVAAAQMPVPSPRAPASLAEAPAAVDAAPLAEAARACLPMIAEAALIDMGLVETVPEKMAEFEQAAAAARAPALVTLLQNLGAAPAGAPRLGLLADLIERLAWLEEQEGVDAGTQDAAFGLRRELEAGLRAAVKALPARLAGLSGGDVKEAISAVEDLLVQAQLLRLPHSLRLLRQSLQLLREIDRGHLPAGGALVGLLPVAIALPGELLEGLEEDEPYRVMCAQLEDKLEQAALRKQQGEDLAERCAAVRERFDISAATLATLDGAAVDRLEAAIGRHDTLVEIEADMESAFDAGRALIDWLRANGTLVSNHSVYAPGNATTVSLRFLVALGMPFEAVSEGLAALDPQPQTLILHHCVVRDLTTAAATPAAATPAPARPGAGNGNAAAVAANGTLRVDSGAVDAFVNRVGEMVMLRNMMSHGLNQDDLAVRQGRAALLLRERSAERPLSNAELQELRELLSALAAQHEQLVQADMRLQGSLSRLQEEAMALRVVPIALVFNRLPRVVRDLSQMLGRLVRLDISGEEVRIDKGMVDVLSEPMLHLVRNGIDHGIETPAQRRAAGKPDEAVLSVSARQQGNTLIVEVADDGRGLDYERIRKRALANGLITEAEAAAIGPRELGLLIFLPGFSTAEQITEVSGRGVGMDAVKTRVLQLGGQVEVHSEPGAGTTFTLRMPLSAAIQNVILVDAAGRQLGIPERNVTEIFQLPVAQLQAVQGQACCLLRGVTLPLYHLGVLLGHGEFAPAAGGSVEIVVMTDGVYRIGIVVERVVGRPEVFLRDIHPDLVRLPGVGGASILGDGRVVIILDCESLFDLAVRHAQSLRTLLRVP